MDVDDLGRRADERAQEIESLRRLPDDLARDLPATGLPRAWVPARYGGGEEHPLDVLDAIERLAAWDGATGWCGMIAATTGLTAAFLPERWAQEIYGDPASITGGFAMPAGTATEVEGGIVGSGRWSWGSGASHCTWIGGGLLLERADGSRSAPFVFFEPGQVELLDTWHVAGLRGTGSTDYAVDEAFVPEGRWMQLGGEPVVDGPLYRFPFLGALALGVSAVALGLARRAQDELVAIAGEKRPAGSNKPLAERAAVQAELARAEAAWRSARALVREAVAETWAASEIGDRERRALRLAATNAAWRAAEAVDLAYHAGGGSSIHESSPLQRVFRDVHVATQHGMVATRTYEVLGRMGFGLPTDAGML